MGFTKFRVTVGTSLCTTAQHISSKIKAFLHHLCWVILILNYAIPYLTPLSLTYPEVRFPWSTQKSQYFFSSQNVFDCQKWLSKFVQSIDIMTIFQIRKSCTFFEDFPKIVWHVNAVLKYVNNNVYGTRSSQNVYFRSSESLHLGHFRRPKGHFRRHLCILK